MLFVIMAFFLKVSNAYMPSEGNVTMHVGPFFYKTDFKEEKTLVKSPEKTDLGLIVNGDINTYSALEIGMFHLNKRFLRRDAQQYISEEAQVIHITMGYKRWLAKYMSASLAFFSAYPFGRVHTVYNDISPGLSLPTSARDTTEYGFDLALQGELWQGKEFQVVADLRYSLSVTSRKQEESNHYGAFVGLRYLIQEKFPEKKPVEEKPPVPKPASHLVEKKIEPSTPKKVPLKKPLKKKPQKKKLKKPAQRPETETSN